MALHTRHLESTKGDRMEQCKCPNCGAAINIARRICEYCGTTFKLDDLLTNQLEPLKIVVQRPGVKVLGASLMVNEFDVHHGMVPEGIVRSELASKLADELMKHMEIQSEIDVERMRRVFSVRLRVLDPAFKF